MKKHLRRRMLRAMAVLLLAVFAVVALAAGASRLVYGRSLRATLYEWSLRRRFATDRTAETEVQRLENLKSGEEKKAKLPGKLKFESEVREDEVGGMQVFTLNAGASGDAVVLYLHGGAYINSFNAYQWRFMDRLACRADCRVVAPAYHLAPWADYRRAYAELTALYREMLASDPDRRLILMGDSAGGGLALGLAEHLAAQGEALPERLILFSPWVDVSMDNPDIADYVPVEPMLHLELVKVHGQYWAGGGDTRDWRVSPLFGDMAGLPPVTVYCGTRELLYPDILLAAEKLERAGVEVALTVGKGLNHDYPLMPLPEAARAVGEVVAIVKGQGS